MRHAARQVLAIDGGSSSIEFALFETTRRTRPASRRTRGVWTVRVVATDEEIMIGQAVDRLLASSGREE